MPFHDIFWENVEFMTNDPVDKNHPLFNKMVLKALMRLHQQIDELQSFLYHDVLGKMPKKEEEELRKHE